MVNKTKNDFNYDLIKKISEKSFTQKNFEDISTSSNYGTENVLINSINNTEKFTSDSIKHIYSLPKNSFALIADKNKNIYLSIVIPSYNEEERLPIMLKETIEVKFNKHVIHSFH